MSAGFSGLVLDKPTADWWQLAAFSAGEQIDIWESFDRDRLADCGYRAGLTILAASGNHLELFGFLNELIDEEGWWDECGPEGQVLFTPDGWLE